MRKVQRQISEISDKLIAYLSMRESRSRDCEDEVWKKIETAIDVEKKKYFFARRSIYIPVSVAASILFCIFFGKNLLMQNDTSKLDVYVAQLSEVAVADTAIQLFLSPEKRVEVQKNGALIAYSKSGMIQVDDEKQADEESSEEFNQIVVPKGKYTQLTLSDGSLIYINSGTRVVYPRVFKKNHREIYVEGEVCIDVTRNEEAPFMVKTSKFDIEVLGTTFNVNAYKDEDKSEVVLVKGAIRLSDKSKKVLNVEPNQLVTVKDGVVVGVSVVDASDYTAWTRGHVLLHTESLGEIFRKMSHFYGKEIRADSDVKNLTIDGKIHLEQPLDDLMELIAVSMPIQYTMNGGIYIVSKKK